MMKQFNPSSPYIHSLPVFAKDILETVRSNIIGGLCSNPHRMITLDEKDTEAPHAAKFAPNGNPYNAIVAYDFNRLA